MPFWREKRSEEKTKDEEDTALEGDYFPRKNFAPTTANTSALT